MSGIGTIMLTATLKGGSQAFRVDVNRGAIEPSLINITPIIKHRVIQYTRSDFLDNFIDIPPASPQVPGYSRG